MRSLCTTTGEEPLLATTREKPVQHEGPEEPEINNLKKISESPVCNVQDGDYSQQLCNIFV